MEKHTKKSINCFVGGKLWIVQRRLWSANHLNWLALTLKFFRCNNKKRELSNLALVDFCIFYIRTRRFLYAEKSRTSEGVIERAKAIILTAMIHVYFVLLFGNKFRKCILKWFYLNQKDCKQGYYFGSIG